MLIRREQIDVDGFKSIFSQIGHTHIATEVSGLHAVSKSGNYDDLINKPSSLPANGGNADTVDNKIINDDFYSADNLWTSEKTKNYIDQSNESQNVELQSLRSSLDNKAERQQVSLLEEEMTTLATKDSLNIVEQKLLTLATKKELSEINTTISTKANKTDITRIDEELKLKTSNEDFKLLRTEVIDARKGKISLLEKINELEAKLDSLMSMQDAKVKNLKIGSIVWYAGDTAPHNFAVCDGSEISRQTYSELFSLIGTRFGEGDNSNTFNLPNLVDDNSYIRANGTMLSLGQHSTQNLSDVRQSYEGIYNDNKLYLVGGKYFSDQANEGGMQPNSITFLPCIKISDKKETDTPVGIFNWFACSDLPEDYLLCDGKEVNRTEYSALFDIIGTKYGEGDGRTTFKLPDLTSVSRFVKASKTVGQYGEGDVQLTDVRKAYEGEANGDKFYPLGGKYFSSPVEDSELAPPSLALIPAIKAKNLESPLGFEVGAFTWFANSSKPVGYLLCDGSEISRTTYKDLFDKIGTTFGEGNGVSTFNLPDLMKDNKFIRSATESIPLGTIKKMSLGDIRNAYEGEHNTGKLYPIGAKNFTSENLFSDIQPNNMALLPCIKSENLKEVNVVAYGQQIDELRKDVKVIQAQSLASNKVPISASTNVIEFNVELKNGRNKSILNRQQYGIVGKSCYINVSNTELGEEYICDVVSNAKLDNDNLTIYTRSLNDELGNKNISLTINIL